MFADIAPTYDRLNHLLSLNIDRLWRKKAVRAAGLGPGSSVLDVCTGTGDLAFACAAGLGRHGGGAVCATDFCAEMVSLAVGKSRDRKRQEHEPEVCFGVADTLSLPFASNAFDAVTVGFGIRNVDGLEDALREMGRVLKPGGRVVVLEFTTPRSAAVRAVFGLYFNRILPRIGRWLSSAPDPDLDDAYRYLPDSVSRFPGPAELAKVMERNGFENVGFELATCGIVAVHRGTKPAPDGSEKATNEPAGLV